MASCSTKIKQDGSKCRLIKKEELDSQPGFLMLGTRYNIILTVSAGCAAPKWLRIIIFTAHGACRKYHRYLVIERSAGLAALAMCQYLNK
jgi:hypothetical protein